MAGGDAAVAIDDERCLRPTNSQGFPQFCRTGVRADQPHPHPIDNTHVSNGNTKHGLSGVSSTRCKLQTFVLTALHFATTVSLVTQRYKTLADYIEQTEESHQSLAARIGVSRPYMTLLVLRQRTPALPLAIRIVHETGVPYESLVRVA